MSFIAKVRTLLGLRALPHPNESVRKKLRVRGDFGKRPRLVIHTASFKTESQAAAFKTFVQFRGYEIGESEDITSVKFQQVSGISGRRFDAETDALRREAEDLYGTYDGLGCASLR